MTGRSVTSSNGRRSSVTGGSASTSLGVSAPSSAIPRSGRTTSPSTSAAKWRPARAQLAKRTRLGPRRGEPDVEVAGEKRAREAVLRQFVGVLVAGHRPYERRLDRSDGVVVQVGVAGEEHLRDEPLVPVGIDLEMDVRR